MKLIPIHEAQADMIVYKDIYNSDGKVLVAKGVKLTQRYIQRLRDFNIRSIEVRRETEPDMKVEEKFTNLWRQTADDIAFHANHAIKRHLKTDTDKQDLMLLVEEQISLILNDHSVIKHAFRLKVVGDGSFLHSIQVAVLSLAIGLELALSKSSLLLLGKAALLYDIGKTHLHRDLLLSDQTYSDAQKNIMQEHTVSGFKLLSHQFPEEIALVALQHHERFNGSGYPYRMRNDALHLYSRIVAVADVFIALKSRRQHRQAFQPYEAYEYILGSGDYLFDSRVVNAFHNIVVLYPPGTVVQLNDNRIGLVTAIHPKYGQRPDLALIYDAEMRALAHQRLALSEHPTCFITRVLHE